MRTTHTIIFIFLVIFNLSVLIFLVKPGIINASSEVICNPALPAALGGCSVDPPTGSAIIARLLARFFATSLAVGSLAFLIYLVYGAFQWLTAGENKSKMESARSIMIQATIGLIILASIFAIGRIVGTLLELQCTLPDGSTVRFPDYICWPEFPTPGP